MTRNHSGDSVASTLHRVWTGTIVKLLVLMVCIGVVAIGASLYERTVLRHSTAQIQRTMSAQAALTGALQGINDPSAIGMMYGTGNTVPPATLRAGYELTRVKLNDAFDAAGRVMTDPALRSILSRARQTWQSMDAGVLAAPALVASGALDKALAKGIDPNKATVWDNYNAINTDFAALSTESVAVLQRRTAAHDQTVLVAPVLLASLLVGGLLGLLAIRRMKRQVLIPLLSLRRAALAMRESRLDHTIELNDGVIEIRELAETLNEASVALGATHRILQNQANTDTLTGLPNRKAFTEHLYARLTEQRDHRMGVLFIDLDDFKDVNDRFGHAAGDELLFILARRLRSGTRDNEFVARLGGDEFGLVVDCGDHEAEALAVAERVIAALTEPVRIGDATATVSCSIGITTSGAAIGEAAADELVRNADFAMYMAKSRGKNCFEVFAPAMHADALARTELKRDFSRAIGLDQLVLHYQPVVNLDTGALRGFEALLRWQHPTRDLLAPGDFMHLPADTDEIIEIGSWVLARACEDLAFLRRATPEGSTLQMAINVSAHQISGAPFVDNVKNLLDRNDIPADAITLEITEAVAFTNTGVATNALTALRKHGMLIALDDFGVGYSSLRYLHELPIDIIKIDRSFVMDQDGKACAMLQAIVTLGHSLGLEIIAEGIETPTELERLRRFDHIAGQGYLFARPMPLADAINFAHSHSLSTAPPTSWTSRSAAAHPTLEGRATPTVATPINRGAPEPTG